MATRDITSAMASAAAAKEKHALAFVEMDFSSGFVRVTSAAFDVGWDAKTWQGVAKLGAIEQVRETVGIEAVALKFAISGVDTTAGAKALGEHYQGRPAKLWLAYVEPGTGIVADPAQVFVGRMDQMVLLDGPTSTVSVTTESAMATWGRQNTRRFSDADQQNEYPGDLGMRDLAAIASGVEVRWGRS